jgi:hypothetical protein
MSCEITHSSPKSSDTYQQNHDSQSCSVKQGVTVTYNQHDWRPRIHVDLATDLHVLNINAKPASRLTFPRFLLITPPTTCLVIILFNFYPFDKSQP